MTFHRNLKVSVKVHPGDEIDIVHAPMDDVFIDGNNKLTIVRWGVADEADQGWAGVLDHEEWHSFTVEKS